jgi:hypothetical protein
VQQGRSGQSDSPAGQGEGGRNRAGASPGTQEAGGDLQKLRQDYQRELERAQRALGPPSSGVAAGGTPEREEFSRSAPGTQGFKQDRAHWESLRKDIDVALERREAAASQRLARKRSEDRFSAGGSDRVPDGYRRSVAKYFELLARDKKQP